MIRFAARSRRCLSGRTVARPGSVRNARGDVTASHHTPNRCMGSSAISDSDAGLGGADEFPPVDESLGKILPGFGSTPISPELDPAPAAMNSTSIAEQISAFEPTWWPSDQMLVLLNWVHECSGFSSYACTIGATTIVFRTLLFPLFASGQRNSSRMGHMQPELKIMKDQIEKMGKKIDLQTQQRSQKQIQALFKKYNCNPMIALVAPLASMPIFMSMFFAMRNAPDVFPDLLSTGGILWFPDLTVADPYCIMPALSALTFLGMTEVGKDQMTAQDPVRGRLMVNLFRGLAIAMVPITMNFSSSIFVYWSVNNTWSFMQALLLKQPSVKKYFGIWDPPKPVPGQEAKSIFDEVTNMINKNEKKEDPNAWAADRVKAHNEIIEQQKVVKRKLIEKMGYREKGRRKR